MLTLRSCDYFFPIAIALFIKIVVNCTLRVARDPSAGRQLVGPALLGACRRQTGDGGGREGETEERMRRREAN